jgi:hypothetical protein
MRFGTGNRRAALDGLTRILDASALEDLFTGPDDDAVFIYDLLAEVARGRSSSCYWEICRTARRRGVSPEYVIDRAEVLRSSIDERRRIDAYRILGVEPLASAEAIRHRWLEFAKRVHPDVGGDPALFRRVKGAYELLRDPQRRGEYERYWMRALGPFERVVPRDADAEPPVPRATPPERRLVMVGKRGTLVEPVVVPDAPPAEPASLAQVVTRVRAMLREIDPGELAAVRERLSRETVRLETLQHHLAAVLAMKQRLGV